MSFLAEVLSSAEKVEIEYINKQIPDIKLKIQNYKQDLLKYIEDVYFKYLKQPTHDKNLLNTSIKLTEDIAKLDNSISQITQKEIVASNNKISAYKKELKEAKCALNIASQLIRIHEGLLLIKDLQKTQNHIEAMKEFKNVQNYIASIYEDDHVDVLETLSLRVNRDQYSYIYKITNIFNANVELIESKPYSIKLQPENEEMKQVLQAFALYSSTIKPLDDVTKFLWNYVFSPIINYKTKVQLSEVNNYYQISIIVITEDSKDTYKTVFNHLVEVLNYLEKYFNYDLQKCLTTLSYIGNDLRDNLSELIIKNCLSDTIPSNSEELQKYKVVIDDTEILQKKLIECNIFTVDTCSILEHANNVDILFINKKCQDYLKTAHVIMKKDLHDMIEVGTPHDISKPLAELSDEFPLCCISKSCLELIELAENIINKAITSTDVCSGRLYCTVQNIFYEYESVTLEYHQKLLKTIPQQIALFHNNCMYLSFTLTKWDETYQRKLPPILHSDPGSFMDKANLLKSIGNQAFIECIQLQIKQIEDIMNDSGIVSVHNLTTLDASTEKCVRQCLRQQELLKTVWHKVLSYLDYNRSIGCILNFLCKYIINAVLKIEDISSHAAEQLADIFKVILTRGPKLFSDSKEIHLYVQHWYKFNELVFILSSSLVDIGDRWAEGKGPLALQFKPDEVKQLIRALFQNTDRRAAILAKI